MLPDRYNSEELKNIWNEIKDQIKKINNGKLRTCGKYFMKTKFN